MIKLNEVSQKQQMKQLIVINSTGRHRKTPSEFSGAKTIKRNGERLKQAAFDGQFRENSEKQPSRLVIDHNIGLR